MANYNPKNERIKRAYFELLEQADQKSPATINQIRKAIHRFESHTEFADFSSFGKQQAMAFKKHMLTAKKAGSDQPLSRATVHTTMRSLQDFLRWLSREVGYRSKINAQDIRYLNLSRNDVAVAQSSGNRKVPTLEQIIAALEAMPTQSEVECRDGAIFAFAILTGVRDSALISLKLKHVNLDERLVTQDPAEVRTKFSKKIETYFFPVGKEVEAVFAEWVRYLREEKLYGDDDPLFPKTRVAVGAQQVFIVDGLEPKCWSTAEPVRKIFRKAFERVELPYFTPHSFRSTLTRLGERVCKTPEEFKAWSQNLGHESPLTTFTSYGQVPVHRQGELVRNAGSGASAEEKLDKLMAMVERFPTV